MDAEDEEEVIKRTGRRTRRRRRVRGDDERGRMGLDGITLSVHPSFSSLPHFSSCSSSSMFVILVVLILLLLLLFFAPHPPPSPPSRFVLPIVLSAFSGKLGAGGGGRRAMGTNMKRMRILRNSPL